MIGLSESIVIAAFVLVLLFGGKKIPELFRAAGRSVGEFRKGKQEVENELKKV